LTRSNLREPGAEVTRMNSETQNPKPHAVGLKNSCPAFLRLRPPTGCLTPPSAKQSKDPPAYRGGLAADHAAGQRTPGVVQGHGTGDQCGSRLLGWPWGQVPLPVPHDLARSTKDVIIITAASPWRSRQLIRAEHDGRRSRGQSSSTNTKFSLQVLISGKGSGRAVIAASLPPER
jgi:hypothetical protein